METIYPVNEINYRLFRLSSSLAINNFYLSAERRTKKKTKKLDIISIYFYVIFFLFMVQLPKVIAGTWEFLDSQPERRFTINTSKEQKKGYKFLFMSVWKNFRLFFECEWKEFGSEFFIFQVLIPKDSHSTLMFEPFNLKPI